MESNCQETVSTTNWKREYDRVKAELDAAKQGLNFGVGGSNVNITPDHAAVAKKAPSKRRKKSAAQVHTRAKTKRNIKTKRTRTTTTEAPSSPTTVGVGNDAGVGTDASGDKLVICEEEVVHELGDGPLLEVSY